MTPAARQLLAEPPLARALDLLDGDGEAARLVGGAVRNVLMARPVTDYDITTTATPDVVMARAAAARLRTIPTGLKHGTVTLIVDDRPFEVTTLREDVATDGRHATVRFGRDFAADALRRDFTINALSLDRAGTVHDYAGGLDDLQRRRVRFIGDPSTRIREDYLRILRFFRFSAQYAEGPLDADGLAAAISERAGLARLSRERVRQELLKLLVACRAAVVVAAVADAGFLGDLLQAAPRPQRLARLLAVAPTADAILRLAALAATLPEDVVTLRRQLLLSNAETARLEGATAVSARLHGLDTPPPEHALLGLMLDHGRRAAEDGLMLAAAEAPPGAADAWRDAARLLAELPEPRLPFSGADLIARGIPQGRPLGEALKRLRTAWVSAGLPRDREALEALLRTIAADRPE